MAQLYADENFSRLVVEELRRLGHDVLTALEAGQANQRIPDPDVLAFAINEGRALLTFNRLHFIRLHRHTLTHSGIIACTQDPDSAALAARIGRAIASASSLTDALIRINRPS
jgi:hypothetical protein